MIHPLVLKGRKVLSKNLGQKIHELLCIIGTLTICVDSHGRAYYGRDGWMTEWMDRWMMEQMDEMMLHDVLYYM